jgi:hypothetical protein
MLDKSRGGDYNHLDFDAELVEAVTALGGSIGIRFGALICEFVHKGYADVSRT